MRRQPIVKSLAVVAALGACAIAAPSASAMRDVATPDSSITNPVPQSVTAADLHASAGKSTPAAQTTATRPGRVGAGRLHPVPAGSDSGFDWGDAGIGAGGALMLVAVAGGGVLLVARRRTSRSEVSPAAS